MIDDAHEHARRLSDGWRIGSRVEFWPGAIEGPGREGHIRCRFFVTPGGDVCAMVREYGSWIAATHIAPAT